VISLMGWCLFNLWTEGRPWQGRIQDCIRARGTLRDGTLRLTASARQVFLAGGSYETYTKIIPNPEMNSYEKRFAQWRKDHARWENEDLPAWERAKWTKERSDNAGVGTGIGLGVLVGFFLGGPLGARGCRSHRWPVGSGEAARATKTYKAPGLRPWYRNSRVWPSPRRVSTRCR
jgi:hypothetical protein